MDSAAFSTSATAGSAPSSEAAEPLALLAEALAKEAGGLRIDGAGQSEAFHQLAHDMQRVGGAAAVAADQQLSAGCKRLADELIERANVLLLRGQNGVAIHESVQHGFGAGVTDMSHG